MKIKVLIFLVFILCINVYSQSVMEMNGYDWQSFSVEGKRSFTHGVIVENYTTIRAILRFYGLEQAVLEPFIIRVDTDQQLIDEITAFYDNTGELEYPLGVVIHIRNEWKYQEIKPWESVKSE